ncbi:type II secretion system protein [Halalkalibacter akibai]|uniref:General secretion pathway protein G n=1 Tax=Halalkalibacter akibai (strain ATCC 43226 / DSM 21942 / CIP 109018 / JCM 9157 / 1139) TaxID=1236973 RepID=W4QTL6_HALA3|nr:type II secretion system protein [Halalkalibacter akibai]GAE34943.1 general secretion pathway protein G [Halalkalibacter akibai JCM 9157]
MRKLIQKRLKNQKGLTLIELLVVIVILGIIAAVTIPMIMGNTERANAATNETNMKIINDALSRYETLNEGKLPSGADKTLVKILEESGVDEGGPYLDEIPGVEGCESDFAFDTSEGGNANRVIIPNGCPGGEPLPVVEG